MKRIFVQMVSYRDPECHHTLTSLFENASHPERISVGLCWQFHPEEDADFLKTPYPRADQVKVTKFHINEAQGAGWARVEAQKLWAGEEYILQIQAHHRFEPGWDETLIGMLESLPTKKAILTAWLPDYQPPDNREELHGMMPIATLNRLADLDDAQMIHMAPRMVSQQVYDAPFLTGMWVGNFMFTHAEVMKAVPFDPNIYFWGEELNYSARLWTSGYDIYHLNQVVLYHYWNRKEARDADQYREHRDRRNQRSLARNLHLMGFEESKDPETIRNIMNYALGDARELADYFSYLGIDWPNGMIAEHARLGRFGGTKSAPRIFVSMAAFRDPEVNPTLADLFSKAAQPERITVGVCQQLKGSEDEACRVTNDYEGRVRVKTVDISESKGAGWARAEAMALHQDEDYILQIDSHMRFEPGWDAMLIEMQQKTGEKDAVISAYANNYDPPDSRDVTDGYTLRIKVRRLGDPEDAQLVHLTGHYVPEGSVQAGLYHTPFIIMNFIFAPAETWKRVPIDPHFRFYGDELSHTARLWTHGINIYQPDRRVAFHYWKRYDEIPKHDYRRAEQQALSFDRIRHLLGLEKSVNAKAIENIENYGLGKIRSMEGFWRFAGVDLKTRHVSDNARSGIWNERAPARQQHPRIFVQIASYRDLECQRTVKDLFEKATHPERIFVGICWQHIPEEDQACFEIPYPYPNQVRVIDKDARESQGACWARSLTQTLWQGEEFSFQIDSHMRFDQGWDEGLVTMWKQCRNPKAIISCYPAAYHLDGRKNSMDLPRFAASHFSEAGILHVRGISSEDGSNATIPPLPGALASGNYLFGPSSLIADVPYDPHLYFYGEEISIAVRLWTHGYDFFNPNKTLVYHLYKGKIEDPKHRRTHFADHKEWPKRDQLAYARVRHLLGTQISTDPEVLVELDKYGLGNVRSLKEYEAYSGIDFVAKTFSQSAKAGRFKPVPPGIFVRIASYRDPECQHTIKDLFEKATHPERIRVGICWQFDEREDAHCFQIVTRPEQVKMISVDWRDTKGVCWARAQTETLWGGEPYTLQIDSHMRFTPGWDVKLIEELAKCPSDKPLLTMSPAKYTPPDTLDPDLRPMVRKVTQFTDSGNIRGIGERLATPPSAPLPGAFVAGGFVFSRSEIMQEVPYDPYLYFDQEEISYALRLFTHGWDVYSATTQFLYHYYNTGDTGRPMHWEDTKIIGDEARKHFIRHAMERFNHLTGYRMATQPEALAEMDKYGLGSVRSIRDFEDYTGIDFKKKVAGPRALNGEFIPGIRRYRRSQPPAHIVPVSAEGREAFGIGDQVPHYVLKDMDGNDRQLANMASKPNLFFFIPYQVPEKNGIVISRVRQMLAEHPGECHVTFFVDAPVDEVKAYHQSSGSPFPFYADPGRQLARLIGANYASGYVLGKNLQIKHIVTNVPPEQLAERTVNAMYDHLQAVNKLQPQPQRVITETAPVLILPDIFTPQFCQHLIDIFHSGATMQGTVGTIGYKPNSKMRWDHIATAETRRIIDLKLSRSVFPQIERVFGFKVTGRENYKIALYKGDEQGFFSPHRDNYEEFLGYRRVAMTINLSDDYDGGALRFPEYDNNLYRPSKGSAILFPATIMHEATKVTRGDRYVVVGFFHTDVDEAFRKHSWVKSGRPLKDGEFTPELQDMSGLPQSRDFYHYWKKKQ